MQNFVLGTFATYTVFVFDKYSLQMKEFRLYTPREMGIFPNTWIYLGQILFFYLVYTYQSKDHIQEACQCFIKSTCPNNINNHIFTEYIFRNVLNIAQDLHQHQILDFYGNLAFFHCYKTKRNFMSSKPTAESKQEILLE